MARDVYAVVDVGGTKLLLIMVQPDGTVVYREKFSTLKESEEFDLADEINRAMEEGLKAGNYSLMGAGVCMAGLLDFRTGQIFSAPNLPVPYRYPLGEKLKEKWKVPVMVENDCNAAVLGEVFFGAARGKSHVIYVTVSTGIGTGFFLQNRLYRGARGFAAEAGHTKTFGDLTCNCGGKGCLESETSGEAISRKAVERLANTGIEEISTREVFQKARKGDPDAAALIEEALEKLGLGLANLVTLLDPEAVIIGGGVSAEEETIFPRIREGITAYSFNPAAAEVEIRKAELEPEAGVWGMFQLLNQA